VKLTLNCFGRSEEPICMVLGDVRLDSLDKACFCDENSWCFTVSCWCFFCTTGKRCSATALFCSSVLCLFTTFIDSLVTCTDAGMLQHLKCYDKQKGMMYLINNELILTYFVTRIIQRIVKWFNGKNSSSSDILLNYKMLQSAAYCLEQEENLLKQDIPHSQVEVLAPCNLKDLNIIIYILYKTSQMLKSNKIRVGQNYDNAVINRHATSVWSQWSGESDRSINILPLKSHQ